MLDRVDDLVDLLGCSIAEAQSIIDHDTKIDKNLRTEYDLSKDQEKKALKYANVTEHKKPVKKNVQRKENATKKSIIEELCKVLVELGYENISPVNDQKFIYFMCGKDIYTLNLTQSGKKTYDKTLQVIKEYQSKK